MWSRDTLFVDKNIQFFITSKWDVPIVLIGYIVTIGYS